MLPQYTTIHAKAHDGKVVVNATIPVSGDAEDYLISIEVVPQYLPSPQSLDHLYGALADTPLPEITDEALPEMRDDIEA
jgi:hypothetical protein